MVTCRDSSTANRVKFVRYCRIILQYSGYHTSGPFDKLNGRTRSYQNVTCFIYHAK